MSDEEIQDEFSLKETNSWQISTARKKFNIKGIDDEKIIRPKYFWEKFINYFDI